MAIHIEKKTAPADGSRLRWILVSAIVATVFVATYAFANAQSGGGLQPAFDTYGAYGTSGGYAADPYGGGADGGAGGGCGGGCCGGSGETVEGETEVTGDVQRIAVDTSSGDFSPNLIKAQAGIPLEIEFSQAPGGCLSGVLIPDFQIAEDLMAGPKTIELPALEPGEYTFWCDMQMISGKIVVE